LTNKCKVNIFKIGQSEAVFLPAQLRRDSTWPFAKDKKELVMEIRGEEIVLRKIYPKELIE